MIWLHDHRVSTISPDLVSPKMTNRVVISDPRIVFILKICGSFVLIIRISDVVRSILFQMTQHSSKKDLMAGVSGVEEFRFVGLKFDPCFLHISIVRAHPPVLHLSTKQLDVVLDGDITRGSTRGSAVKGQSGRLIQTQVVETDLRR